MRRYMMKIAEHFAKKDGCLGLITGESIGQVASQTMQSLAATNAVCTLPVYRPLIGFDKKDIVEISEKINTYETSIQPFEDCCTIFVAKHPVTKPNIERIEKSELNLAEKIDELMQTAIDTAEIIEVKQENNRKKSCSNGTAFLYSKNMRTSYKNKVRMNRIQIELFDDVSIKCSKNIINIAVSVDVQVDRFGKIKAENTHD